MPAYLIAEMKFRELDWINDYMAVVPDIVKKHGGVHLVQALEADRVEGSRSKPDVVVVIQFPSMDDAYGFINDPEYQPYSDARRKGTESDVVLVPGIEALITSVSN